MKSGREESIGTKVDSSKKSVNLINLSQTDQEEKKRVDITYQYQELKDSLGGTVDKSSCQCQIGSNP